MAETLSCPPSELQDDELVARIRAGEKALFEEMMRRYNQRLYRVVRAILKSELEVEDVMQQAYVQAFQHLDQFAGRSQFSTWLTRIAIHAALGRRRQQTHPSAASQGGEHLMATVESDTPDPERLAYAGELRSLLESSIDSLPDAYRLVFVCREIEGLSTSETADLLEVGGEAVKTRLHRARAILRRELFNRVGGASADAFAFHLSRCDRVVRAVLEQLAAS
jgi:RNA polymerase sigma-70 factor (ECF subfamily)